MLYLYCYEQPKKHRAQLTNLYNYQHGRTQRVGRVGCCPPRILEVFFYPYRYGPILGLLGKETTASSRTRRTRANLHSTQRTAHHGHDLAPLLAWPARPTAAPTPGSSAAGRRPVLGSPGGQAPAHLPPPIPRPGLPRRRLLAAALHDSPSPQSAPGHRPPLPSPVGRLSI